MSSETRLKYLKAELQWLERVRSLAETVKSLHTKVLRRTRVNIRAVIKQLSAMNAAAKVLANSDESVNAKQLIDVKTLMAYWINADAIRRIPRYAARYCPRLA